MAEQTRRALPGSNEFDTLVAIEYVLYKQTDLVFVVLIMIK